MNPIEALAKVGELIKLFNVIEEKQKQQEAEIIRLREDNASLRK